MSNAEPTEEPRRVPRLREAMRLARIELAERTGVVVDLRDAELARLELLNEQLDPVFADIPDEIELFDRGIIPGDPPRLWIDMLAHVAMGRDKRVYRFLQDTRYGRRVIAESVEAAEIAEAVTRYIARRMVERERMLADGDLFAAGPAKRQRLRQRGYAFAMFLVGLLSGAAVLSAIAWFLARP